MIKNTLYEILNELIKLIKFNRSSQSIVELRKQAKEAIEKKAYGIIYLWNLKYTNKQS